MKAFSLAIVLSFATLALTHSTKYPNVYRNESCINPVPAQIFSYHIHLLYLPNNKDSVEGAYRIRDAFVKDF